MKKVFWLSRHALTEKQEADLKDKIVVPFEVETLNVTWEASNDADHDKEVNRQTWKDLIRKVVFADGQEKDKLDMDVYITGVFPPVALEAIHMSDESLEWLSEREQVRVWLLSPVSKQEKTIRADGNAQIDFVHLRWCEVRHGYYDHVSRI